MRVQGVEIVFVLMRSCTYLARCQNLPKKLRYTLALFVVAVGPSALASAQAADSASALLARAFAYHDPSEEWGKHPLELSFEETRPNGVTRKTRIVIDLTDERFEWRSKRGEDLLAGTLTGDKCSVTFNGSTLVPERAVREHSLDCDRVRLYRDYYTYLWGLPMKLQDPGTRIDPLIDETVFAGQPVHSIRVTYDPSVGGDTWYFYFAPETASLVGYRFFHDEQANDGEYIVLEGEADVLGMRIPKSRTWYTNSGDTLLGTDTLVAAGPVELD